MNQNYNTITFEEIIDDDLYNYNDGYKFMADLRVKEINTLIDDFSNVLYIEGVKYQGYYDINKDLFISTTGIYLAFDGDEVIIYSNDFYVRFNVYEIDIEKGEDNFFNKEDFMVLLEFRRLINKDFTLNGSSESHHYLNIGFLDVYYDEIKFFGSNLLLIKTTNLITIEEIVLDDYIYQLTLKTHKTSNSETIYVIVNVNYLKELDDLYIWESSIKNFINHLTSEELNDGNNPVDFDILEPGIYNFFLNI